MEFTSALIWLVQNPTGFITRGTERCLGMGPNGSLYDYAMPKPNYCRIWVTDIVAADWEPMSREALEAAAARAAQAG